MATNLAQIDELFSRLNEDEQLLLIDHLADRTPYADEISEGIGKAVHAHFSGNIGSYDYTAEQAEVDADHFFPAGCVDPAVWKAHATRRDATLEGAIRLRALERAA